MIKYDGLTCADLGIRNEALTSIAELRFFEVRTVPELRIYGLMEGESGHTFVRMPEKVAETVSPNVAKLNYNTAGGRLRFVTDSEYVALKTVDAGPSAHRNMSPIGSSGFDCYVKRLGKPTYTGTFRTPTKYENGFDDIVYIGKGTKEVTVNFPPYHGVTDLYIGLDRNASLTRHADYTHERPVLYYGSSITEGGCASRPGMVYEDIISRRLDTNYINLGFSGSARAEDTMIEYLASVDCSVFVLDYDHNSGVNELAARHEKLYLRFRETHPTTPVVIVGHPDFYINYRNFDSDNTRREILTKTLNNARARGERVLYVDSYSLFAGEMREECTVDGTHPNDLGMVRMADAIGKAVEIALSM